MHGLSQSVIQQRAKVRSFEAMLFMPNLKHDLTGTKFGRLFIISHAGRSKAGVHNWVAACDCGSIITTPRSKHLVSGASTSCGCLRREKASEYSTIHGDARPNKKTKLYYVYRAMLQRCYKPTHEADEKNYHGRGIRVCRQWREDYVSFRIWALANGYKPGLQIERTNNSGNYEPENCIWATRKVQMLNTRRNRRLVYMGKNLTISQWSEITGINRMTITRRINRGWSVQKTLTKTPVRLREYTRKV
jgi:hypothetical protein